MVLRGFLRAHRMGAILAAAMLSAALAALASTPAAAQRAGTPAGPPRDSASSARIARADLARIRGSDSASVWLIVISDFQCPFCKRWHDETAPRIVERYVRTGRVRIAYLNLPIRTHRNAWPAHELAMCAAEQDRFWPAADAIFARQDAWKGRNDAPLYFDSLARTLPLDHARLRRCTTEGWMRPLIQADYDRVTRLGVGSTPTFFVGDQVLIGAQPYEAFASALDAALAAARRR